MNSYQESYLTESTPSKQHKATQMSQLGGADCNKGGISNKEYMEYQPVF